MDGSERNVEALRDLRRRVGRPVPKCDDRSALQRQGEDCIEKSTVVHDVLVARRGRGDQAGRAPARCCFSPRDIQGSVQDDAEEPRPERAPSVEGREPSERPFERLLRHIVCSGRASRYGESETPGAKPMARKELLAGAPGAGNGFGYELSVFRLVHLLIRRPPTESASRGKNRPLEREDTRVLR
jgi:hypothetical protein